MPLARAGGDNEPQRITERIAEANAKAWALTQSVIAAASWAGDLTLALVIAERIPDEGARAEALLVAENPIRTGVG